MSKKEETIDELTKDMIYLDYNAATFIHEKVVEEMKPYLTTFFGNPSSSHAFGVRTKQAVQKAREQVAKMINCKSSEIIFTSGGSESNNYSIKGIILHKIHNLLPEEKDKKFQVMVSSIEHPSVKEVFKYLISLYEKNLELVYLPVTNEGLIDMDKFKSLIKDTCIFISIMHANNETGAIQPIEEISNYAKSLNSNCVIHCDASQSIGKIKVDVAKLNADLLTIASHKFYGPKGIGALFIRQGIEKRLEKIIHGANHEHGMRAGTENVLEIVGFGKACELVTEDLNYRMKLFKKTRNIIYKTLKEKVPNLVLHGPAIDLSDDLLGEKDNISDNYNEKRITNTLYISFPGLQANLILDLLANKIACSAGAACHSDEVKMSYVLSAMNVPQSIAMGTLRISTGLKLTENDALKAANEIANAVNDLYKSPSTSSGGNQNNLEDLVYSCRLTKNTHGMGCGCKISPKILQEVLSSLPKQKCMNNSNILVNADTSDDASVYKIDNQSPDNNSLVSSLDFLTPICDNPYDYGQIAAANALSDIYSMGGTPINALAIVAFPVQRLPIEILKQILKGALDKADEANCPILGGHSIEDNEPKFGLSVNGLVDSNYVWKNCTIENDNVIFYTKKIGVGVIMTALKKDIINTNDKCFISAINYMKTLNKYPSEIIKNLEKQKKEKIISACTDVTGFGLIGHLVECLGNSELCINIDFNKTQFIERALELVEMDVYPGGAKNNINFSNSKAVYDDKISESEKILINDPQTNGGLLLFINKNKVDMVKKEFEDKKMELYEIGYISSDPKKKSIINIYKS